MVRFLRLSAVLPSGAFQAPLVGASVLALLLREVRLSAVLPSLDLQ